MSPKEASETSKAFYERIHKNRLQANKHSIRQYRKQFAISNIEVGESVSVAVSTVDRAFTDDQRIFEQVNQVYNSPSYKIQTKYGV